MHPRFLSPTYPVEDFSFFLGTISQCLLLLVRQSPLRISGWMYSKMILRLARLLADKVVNKSKDCFLVSGDLNLGPLRTLVDDF